MTAAPAPDQDRIDPEVLKRALILVVGFLAVIFDTTIVSVALHTLATQLHASVPTIQWVTTGYLLALGIAVPLSTWGCGASAASGCGWLHSRSSSSARSVPAWRGMSARSSPGGWCRARAAASCSRC
jgi:MFS family permease